MEADAGTMNIWDRLNATVENSATNASFVSFVVFVALTFVGKMSAPFILLWSAVGFIVGKILSNSLSLFINSVISILLSIYKSLERFMINYLAVIIIAIFVLNTWWVGPVFIVMQFVLMFILTHLVGGYDRDQVFNDRAAKELLRRFG